jgi:hypothetical protein
LIPIAVADEMIVLCNDLIIDLALDGMLWIAMETENAINLKKKRAF